MDEYITLFLISVDKLRLSPLPLAEGIHTPAPPNTAALGTGKNGSIESLL